MSQEFNKTEKKYLKKVLEQEIHLAKERITNSERYVQDDRYPNFTKEVHEKTEKKHSKHIEMCTKLMSKLMDDIPSVYK